MRYEFCLSDFSDIMETIYERIEDEEGEFKQIKIAEKEGSELWVFGYRVVIPELDLAVRNGIEYYKNDDGEEELVDSIVVYYSADEKDPQGFNESYCNTYLESIVMSIARDRQLNDNPKCYIDDEEFVCWTSEDI